MTAWQIVGSSQGAQTKSLLLQRIKLQFLVNHCQAIFFSQTQGGLEIGTVMARRWVGMVEWMSKNNQVLLHSLQVQS